MKKNCLILKKNLSFEFLTKALSCHAICLLDKLGILNLLLTKKSIDMSFINESKNPALLRSLFSTLVGSEILNYENKKYLLTELGEEILQYSGSITLPLLGYKKLFEKQFLLASDPTVWSDEDIDYEAIAESSIKFGGCDIDPLVEDLIYGLDLHGTICDLGCGSGRKLVRLCEIANTKGIGIEQSAVVVNEAKQTLKDFDSIEIIQGNITSLNNTWEDVEICILNQVFHDIQPQENCIHFLQSLKTHFPNLRYVLIADFVSLSEGSTSIMPGFDYVHGLQGIVPRNYEETIEVFNLANYNIEKEIEIDNMPNTYIWLLSL